MPWVGDFRFYYLNALLKEQLASESGLPNGCGEVLNFIPIPTLPKVQVI